MVKLRSPYGEATVPVVVTDRVHGQQLYMPMNSVLEPVNRMTGSDVDRATHTPAYKELSVEIIVLPESIPHPLPPENFRNGHRTPQTGVEVERKWQRKDYAVPGGPASEQLVQITTDH
jgi:formate dehydrogenase major subunit